ncbi:poly(ADP-ribose) polymerase family member 14-related sequence 1 isoform 2-T2 [Pholidichthys leucotaenia]
MAGDYAYPLLVEFGENDEKRLKIKLTKYFQSSKKSNGGDCEVEYESGSRTAVLRFRNREDQQNVLAKESHQIPLDKGALKVTVRLPTNTKQDSPPSKVNKRPYPATDIKRPRSPKAKVQTESRDKDSDSDTPEEEVCSTSAVIGNVSETVTQEFVEMLVENILKDPDSPSTHGSFSLEFLPALSSAVVTFQNGKENDDFVTRCPQNRTFKKKELSVRHLEATKRVIVDDTRNLSDDILHLYFENQVGDVEDVVLNKEEQSAIITFKDHKAVNTAIKKKKHQIRKEEIKVYPYYKSLGLALYGKDKPPSKLPAAISESIDTAVWKYLTDNKSAAEIIRCNLAKHFCNVNLAQSTVILSPVSSLLQQQNAKVVIKEWADVVKLTFSQSLSAFKSLKFNLDPEVWDESVRQVRETLRYKGVVIVPDKATGVLSVAGLVNDVSELEKPLSESLSKIVTQVKREKYCKTHEIELSESIFKILCQDGLKDKLLQVYPGLRISFETGGQHLKVTGLNDEITAANQAIFKAMHALKRQNLEIDNFVLQLLKGEQQEKLTDVLLTPNKLNAVFELSTHQVLLLGLSDQDLKEAQNHLRQVLISQYIDVEDKNVLRKPGWLHLVRQLENNNCTPWRKIQIKTTGQQVVVSGHKDSVIKVSRELEDFLTQNAQVEESVVVKPNAIIEYIKNFNKESFEKSAHKVTVSYKKEAICLNGSRVDVVDCKDLVEVVASSVVFDHLNISKPGLKKFFQKNEAEFVLSLKNETSCIVQLVDDMGSGNNNSSLSQVSQPLYQFKTTDGVEIAVCKADMCNYPVQMIINSSNEDLKHNGGLGAALLKAAGPQFQDECDKIIRSKGQLKPGDCVITGAGGQLSCKKVIHTVAPKFDPAQPEKALELLEKAVKGSLELAEQHGCVSVALPAISRGLGFPLDMCATVIVKAVKEHCEQKYNNTLKRIHLVNNDNSATQAMVDAVTQEFGSHNFSHSQNIPPIKLPKSVKPAPSDPNLCHVQTKEGLDIKIIKGNIEAATTEVTVNAIFEELALNKGAISNAILGAAGAKLQQLVDAKNASKNVGEVIVTDGCKLKSKQVFHAIVPHWDKGKGTSAKILSGIFKDCLGMAEDSSLTSLSFPAIGTGNLGFPKDLVASLVLNEIVAFSSTKQPKHLKKVVIILYPGDTNTIQAFIDEFKKKFPNGSIGSVSPSSSQSSVASGLFSKVVSSSGMHETKMGNVTVQVVNGDITKETTDIIINSSNDQFSLKSGVSKAILDAAGNAVEAECQTLGAQPNQGMIMTQPGNLKCKKILHLVGQTDPVKIKKVVTEALQMCATNSYTSVAFPAIGTGQGNVGAKLVADAMMDAVIDVLSQNTPSTLKTIRIVIFQPHMLKEFHSSMQEREGTDPKGKTGFFASLTSKLKLFTIDIPDEPKKDVGYVKEALKPDLACFHICSGTQAKVDSAKQWINDRIAKEFDTTTFEDSGVLSFTDADHKHIVEIQKSMSVGVRTENKQGKGLITIEGHSKDVVKASKEIHKILRKVREDEEKKKKMELAATVADWQYQLQGFHFQSFDLMTNFLLEQALEGKQPSVKVTIQKQDYTVTMPKGPATNQQGNTVNIKRIDKLKGDDIPEHWETMSANATSQAFDVKAGTAEYNEILKLFQATCPSRPVTKIQRIQNPGLWKGLQVKKRDMEVRNGHQKNEKRLFHGTCQTTVKTINDNGFNRSYAGKNATCYGKGTYFAVNASYSAGDTYSKPSPSGEKFMYVCLVLTGDYTLGAQNMIAPPPKSIGSTQFYDSVVDNMTNPSMFVIFHDAQAYPEYLITFK